MISAVHFDVRLRFERLICLIMQEGSIVGTLAYMRSDVSHTKKAPPQTVCDIKNCNQ